MIDGTGVRLRVWYDSDVDVMTDIRNDLKLQAQLLARPRGSRQQQVCEWLEKKSVQGDSMLLIIAEKETDNAIGFIQVSDIEPVDRRAELGICVHQKFQSKGHGTEAVNLVAKYLKTIWNIRKLTLKVRGDNAQAIRCYEKVGFEICGTMRRHVFFDGKWLDVVLMELFMSSKE